MGGQRLRGGAELAEEELALAEPQRQARRAIAARRERPPALRGFGVAARLEGDQSEPIGGVVSAGIEGDRLLQRRLGARDGAEFLGGQPQRQPNPRHLRRQFRRALKSLQRLAGEAGGAAGEAEIEPGGGVLRRQRHRFVERLDRGVGLAGGPEGEPEPAHRRAGRGA